MPIYDQSFRRYTGPRNLRSLWLPVFRFTAMPILRRKLVWLILGLFVLYLGGLSVGFLISAKVVQTIGEESTTDAMRTIRREGLPIFDANISLGTILFVVIQPVTALLWLLTLIAGAGSVSNDRRHNAFPLYFSRPLQPWHYILGKILGIAAIPLSALLLTQWILGLQYIAYYLPATALITELPTFFVAAAYAILMSIFLATAAAAFSSLTKSARISAVAFLGFFIVMENIAPLIAEGSGTWTLLSLSPLHSLDVIGQALLRPSFGEFKSRFNTGTLSFGVSLIAISLYLGLFIWLLRRNLQVVEVVK